MHTRDATGRKVSLLNDEPTYESQYSATHRLSYSAASHVVSQTYHPGLTRSASSSPNTPELLRSASYDSQISNEPLSPMTPNVAYADYGRTVVYADGRSPYEEYMTDGTVYAGAKRPASFADSRTSSYDLDDSATSPAAQATERTGKRYPCRYRDSHGCDKTFTTSGHASRHSKIHTAEKAVQCTFHGCSKKFTRADNMKQHLETHYKDKSRHSTARPSITGRRSSSSGKVSSSKRVDSTPLPSPGVAGGAWDMRALNLPLLNRPSAARTPSSGLDALAMAVACQEGGSA